MLHGPPARRCDPGARGLAAPQARSDGSSRCHRRAIPWLQGLGFAMKPRGSPQIADRARARPVVGMGRAPGPNKGRHSRNGLRFRIASGSRQSRPTKIDRGRGHMPEDTCLSGFDDCRRLNRKSANHDGACQPHGYGACAFPASPPRYCPPDCIRPAPYGPSPSHTSHQPPAGAGPHRASPRASSRIGSRALGGVSEFTTA